MTLEELYNNNKVLQQETYLKMQLLKQEENQISQQLANRYQQFLLRKSSKMVISKSFQSDLEREQYLKLKLFNPLKAYDYFDYYEYIVFVSKYFSFRQNQEYKISSVLIDGDIQQFIYEDNMSHIFEPLNGHNYGKLNYWEYANAGYPQDSEIAKCIRIVPDYQALYPMDLESMKIELDGQITDTYFLSNFHAFLKELDPLVNRDFKNNFDEVYQHHLLYFFRMLHGQNADLLENGISSEQYDAFFYRLFREHIDIKEETLKLSLNKFSTFY